MVLLILLNTVIWLLVSCFDGLRGGGKFFRHLWCHGRYFFGSPPCDTLYQPSTIDSILISLSERGNMGEIHSHRSRDNRSKIDDDRWS